MLVNSEINNFFDPISVSKAEPHAAQKYGIIVVFAGIPSIVK